MTIDFTRVLTKINGESMRRVKDKTDAQTVEERAIAKSGKAPEEIRAELEIIHLRHSDLEDITLAFIAGEALSGAFKGEEEITGAERYDRRKLAKRVYENAQDLTEVEREKIRTLIAKAYAHNALIVGAAFELMDD